MRSEDIANMTYARFVRKLAKPKATQVLDLVHGSFGICKEAGELADNIYRHWNYGHPLDEENTLEEAGDILFYLQLVLNQIGLTIEDAIEANIVKLSKRYKDLTYSDEAALARADKPQGE